MASLKLTGVSKAYGETGRLTTRMFNDVFRRVNRLLDGG